MGGVHYNLEVEPTARMPAELLVWWVVTLVVWVPGGYRLEPIHCLTLTLKQIECSRGLSIMRAQSAL